MSTLDDNRILSCGHRPSPHGPHTTGTAHFTMLVMGGKVEDREICWDCAYEQEKRKFADPETLRFGGYLAKQDGSVYFTTWTGKRLGKVTKFSTGRHNMAPEMWYVSVEAFDGSEWYGRGLGLGMSCGIRRRKGRKA
jgi:hypothetical protein